MINQQNNDQEYHIYMSDLYERVRVYIPDLKVTDFIEIINQPNFSIEDFEISMKISRETEREINKSMLKEKYKQLMESKSND